jgi:pyruvate-formate lyase
LTVHRMNCFQFYDLWSARAYFKLDGHHIQFNVVNADTLREAQKHPEKYGDLMVRVAGYSDILSILVWNCRMK